jgi:hypothetical protein
VKRLLFKNYGVIQKITISAFDFSSLKLRLSDYPLFYALNSFKLIGVEESSVVFKAFYFLLKVLFYRDAPPSFLPESDSPQLHKELAFIEKSNNLDVKFTQ